MTLYFKCSDEEFKNVDLFFANQQFTYNPGYDRIILQTNTTECMYKIELVNDYYYIVTD